MPGLSLEHRFVDTFALAARQAGAVALRLRGKVLPESKPGRGVEAEALTAVDLAAQDVILHLLHERMPGVAVDAEEDTDTLRLFSNGDPQSALVVVDPIDGTLNYMRGSDEFAVMGALLREGRYTAALIHFPVHGRTYWACRGEGVYAERPAREPRRCRAGAAADRILYSPRTPVAWRAALAECASELWLCRCSAIDSSAPATGRARAAVAEDRADRRRAIGLFLSLEAGATIRMGTRAWRGEDPERLPPTARPTVVAANAALADAICNALADVRPIANC